MYVHGLDPVRVEAWGKGQGKRCLVVSRRSEGDAEYAGISYEFHFVPSPQKGPSRLAAGDYAESSSVRPIWAAPGLRRRWRATDGCFVIRDLDLLEPRTRGRHEKEPLISAEARLHRQVDQSARRLASPRSRSRSKITALDGSASLMYSAF